MAWRKVVFVVSTILIVAALIPRSDKPTYGISNIAKTKSLGLSTADEISVLMTGDSQSFTLGEGFVPLLDIPNMNINISAIMGCGVVHGRPVINGNIHPMNFEHCNAWEQTWREGMDAHHPDVVIVLIGAWEILDRIIDNKTYRVGTEEYDSYVKSQLTKAFDLVTAGGTPVVLLSTPCYQETEDSLGGLYGDRNHQGRIEWFNKLSLEVVKNYGELITRLDLGNFLCPNGIIDEDINGINPRPDGVHFSKEGAGEIWNWLIPQVLEIVAKDRNSKTSSY